MIVGLFFDVVGTLRLAGPMNGYPIFDGSCRRQTAMMKENARGKAHGAGLPSSITGLNFHSRVAWSAEELNPTEFLMIFSPYPTPTSS